MSSSHREVIQVIITLTSKIKSSRSEFSIKDISNCLIGIRSMSEDDSSIRDLLKTIANKIKDCSRVESMQHLQQSLYFIRQLKSDYAEVKLVLDALKEQELKVVKSKNKITC